jgi:hypothetical protein
MTAGDGRELRQAALGAVAGVAGALAMTVFIRTAGRMVGGGEAAEFNAAADAQRWASVEPSGDRDLVGSRGAEPPTEVMGRVAHTALTGREPTDATRRRLGTVAHLAVGAGMGALYGLARPPSARILHAGHAAGFGVAMWLIADEILVPLLGLGQGPAAQGGAEHALGLGGHLVFGVSTAGMLGLLHRVAR